MKTPSCPSLLTTGVSSWTYTYDNAGNLTEKSQGPNGTTWMYTYDNRNELLTAEELTKPGGTMLSLSTYTYDVFGNQLSVNQTNGGVTTLTNYAYLDANGSNPVIWADLNGSNTLQMRRLYLPGQVAPYARINSSGTAAWYLTDWEGSVRFMTDNTGAVQDQITYTGFGGVSNETNSSFGDRYKYTGEQYDSVTGLQRNGWREYNLATGQWTSQDPLGLAPGPNPYEYVGNDPTNKTDPSGLQWGGEGGYRPTRPYPYQPNGGQPSGGYGGNGGPLPSTQPFTPTPPPPAPLPPAGSLKPYQAMLLGQLNGLAKQFPYITTVPTGGGFVAPSRSQLIGWEIQEAIQSLQNPQATRQDLEKAAAARQRAQNYADILKRDQFTWEGKLTATGWACLLGASGSLELHAWGKDGNGNLYELNVKGQKQSGNQGISAAVLGAGYWKFTSEFDNVVASNAPIKVGQKVTIGYVGVTANGINIPVPKRDSERTVSPNGTYVTYDVGQLKWSAFLEVNGYNVSLGGGGFYFEITSAEYTAYGKK
jgi:RHS repeat-associated protein